MSMKISRRKLIKTAAAVAAGLGTEIISPAAMAKKSDSIQKFDIIPDNNADLPKAKGPRAVVVGGGFSGLTMAKYLKKYYPSFDVVLVEKNSMFFSCPISNIWLVGAESTDFLLHSYDDAALGNNYIFYNATAINADRNSRILYTDKGKIKYDYLIVAPGIDYDYGKIGVGPDQEYILRKKYPAAFMPGSEHLSLRYKLRRFKGGIFLLTVPSGNYRCFAAPYERACMMADYFKKHRIKGKIVLLDMNPEITIAPDSFHNAFNELYKDYIEYHSDVHIVGVDIEKRQVKANFEGFKDIYDFTDAAIYPPIRAAKLIEIMGIAKPNSQFEADIDPFTYQVKGDEYTYVTGDARPMGYSKSANTANSEAHFVSKIIAMHAQGKPLPKWKSPTTICYGAIKYGPLESNYVSTRYKYSGRQLVGFTDVVLRSRWSRLLGRKNIPWATGLYNDMFK